MEHASLRTCRFCRSPVTQEILDLGAQPPSNSYLPMTETAIAAETRFPLRLAMCEECGLAQLVDDVPADGIFTSEYAYFSSFSPSWMDHAARYAADMTARFGLDQNSFVVEVASNDGYLLRNFVEQGIGCLGVEPAANCAAAAEKVGVKSHVGFFGRETAQHLSNQGIAADLMAANNVLAHVPHIGDFVDGFATLLKPQGVATFEFPHLGRLVEDGQFDTIYHEHYSYLSLTTVERIFAKSGLRVFDVEHLPTHGGSLRVFACHIQADHMRSAMVDEVLGQEGAQQLMSANGLATLRTMAEALRDDFVSFLEQAQADGKTIAGYGAAAKGNTFLNYCGDAARAISFVVDQNPEKQDKLLPGTHRPILAPSALQDRKPDYVVILPWNLRSEIAEQHSYIRDWGGHFVVAQPALEIF